MNDLLFYLILISLLYYFFYYLPHQKNEVKHAPLLKPLTHHQSTQTTDLEPVIEFPSAQFKPVNQEDPEIEKTLDQLIKSIQQLNRQIK